ncbi:MAG: RNA polymerase sigma factor [Ignavibacteriaceae bacterium]|nr:RNA polymerase sigma factor [Ignavibacteriaceae bacterium]
MNPALEFTIYYNKHKKKIFNYIFKMICNKIVSEDIVQNVFLKLYSNLKNIKNQGSIEYWLFTTTRNEIYSYLNKKRMKNERFIDEDISEIYLKNDSEFQKELDLREVKELINEELDKLPVEQKEVFVLREFSGMSYSEIAGLTNVEEKTVKSRLFKVRQKLIEKISKKIS